MKLWDKGFVTDKTIEEFTAGTDRSTDLKLAKYDVQGSIAHAKMLHKIGILSPVELKDILKGLEEIGETIANGSFVIEETFEDVHSKIEFELLRKIGEAAKKIHTARSRNDQVLVDLHLYAREEIVNIREIIKTLFETLMALSEKHKDVLMPGYTHLQAAMPSSFGLWFGAFAETLIDDLILFNAAYDISNQNPLGSAAGYGTSFPVDRDMTTELLGFEYMKYNVIAAQMGRGRLEKSLAFAMASVASTLSKMAMDICLFMSQNFSFVSLPKAFTTGSSIMPHKQNPDVFELLRANFNKIQSLPMEIAMVTTNLPGGYNRDYQATKDSFMHMVDLLKENLSVFNFAVQHLETNKNIMDNSTYDPVFSVESVNKLVMQGVSFRDAYRKIGEQVLNGSFIPEKDIKHTHKGSLGNLCTGEIRKKFDAVYDKQVKC